jgi:hypothetical protein
MLRIRIKKAKDGPPVLTCVRADGSRTWSRVHVFFPTHDLLHCVVESTLGLEKAFFGLVAEGWAIDDFATPRASERMGDEAAWGEGIVGLLDQERASGRAWPAEEFNLALRSEFAGSGRPMFRPVTDSELELIRQRHQDLLFRWRTLPQGDTLEIEFPLSPESPGGPQG